MQYQNKNIRIAQIFQLCANIVKITKTIKSPSITKNKKMMKAHYRSTRIYWTPNKNTHKKINQMFIKRRKKQQKCRPSILIKFLDRFLLIFGFRLFIFLRRSTKVAALLQQNFISTIFYVYRFLKKYTKHFGNSIRNSAIARSLMRNIFKHFQI